jgi:hypothetical protein
MQSKMEEMMGMGKKDGDLWIEKELNFYVQSCWRYRLKESDRVRTRAARSNIIL